jgi:hypothetical protein
LKNYKNFNIEDFLTSLLMFPYTVLFDVYSEVICIRCCKRWICVRPERTLLKDIECPNCGKGAVIETGEVLDEEEAEKGLFIFPASLVFRA